MWLLLLFALCHARSELFGIDFGSDSIKMSTLVPAKGVRLCLNQHSHRMSPSYFAFWNRDDPTASLSTHCAIDDLSHHSWSFFEDARSDARRHGHAVGLSPLMSLRNGLDGREILSLMVRHLLATADRRRYNPDRAAVVFAVDPLLSHSERFAISEAMSISNITLLSIVEAPIAAAHFFALEKRKFFEYVAKTVAFFDVGAAHSWAAIFRFSVANNSVNIEHFATAAAPFGVRAVDDHIPGGRHTKELLTTDQTAQVQLENGTTVAFDRNHLNFLLQDVGGSLLKMFGELLNVSQLSPDDIDAVELLGGGTRIPFVQSAIADATGKTIGRNSDDAIALGAGYIASKEHSMLATTVRLNSRANLDVFFRLANGTDIELFNARSGVDEAKVVTLSAAELRGGCSIVARNATVYSYSVHTADEVGDSTNISLHFHFNKNAMPAMFAALFWNQTQDDRANVTMSLDFPSGRVTQEQYIDCSACITRMEEISRQRARDQQLRNDYEAHVYKLKDRLQNDELLIKVMNESEREVIGTAVADHERWILNEQRTDRMFLTKFRYQVLRNLTRTVDFKADEFVKRPIAFDRLNQSLQLVGRKLLEEWPNTRPTLPDYALWSVWYAYNQSLKFFDEKTAAQGALTGPDMPIVTAEEIDKKRSHLEKVFKLVDGTDDITLATADDGLDNQTKAKNPTESRRKRRRRKRKRSKSPTPPLEPGEL